MEHRGDRLEIPVARDVIGIQVLDVRYARHPDQQDTTPDREACTHAPDRGALIWASAGDAQAKQRGDKVVAALAECQRARGSGYFSAFPEELLDRLRDDRPAWAPF